MKKLATMTKIADAVLCIAGTVFASWCVLFKANPSISGNVIITMLILTFFVDHIVNLMRKKENI